jgi:glutamyl-tRNA synthetase
MRVVTRFAPSPTGFLHIGSARTALFNYLFAKHHNGKFLLRIEDTDIERSTQEAIDAILSGLKWLGLEWDEQEIFQTHRVERHKDAAFSLLQNGKAYKCFMTQEEIQSYRDQHPGKPIRSNWRDIHEDQHPKNQPFVIRLKVPLEDQTIVNDAVQGKVTTKNEILEDNIILRSDGTPTYMLAVVVDDHDMGITHIIRGDDHLTNAARQMLLYQAFGWETPVMAHIPLIHGSDGKKLSKRHGALGVEAYRDMGYLPETLRNYLLRLGWSHGNDEIISDQQAIEWFNLESIGKSPARMDFKKLENLNGHYIKQADTARLMGFIKNTYDNISDISLKNIETGLSALKERAKTINELVENARIYINEFPITFSEEGKNILHEDKNILDIMIRKLIAEDNWNYESLMELATSSALENNIKIGELVKPIRVAITGDTKSPSVFEILSILGKKEALKRLENALHSI